MNKFLPQAFKYIAFQVGPANLMRVETKELQTIPVDSYLMKIKAIGLNRAQIIQRQGKYPLKPGDPNLLGLEAAGEVYDPQTGQKLFNGMALLNGGSYAQYVTVPKQHVMKMPNHLSFIEAAGVTEVWLTSFQLLSIAQVQPDDKVLIYAGASGIGTAALQLCNYLKAKPFPLTSSENKLALCQSLGAKAFSYKNQNWDQQLLKASNNKGFDIILDPVGASFSEKTMKLLGQDSRWVIFGTMGGGKTQIDFNKLLRPRPSIFFTTLKNRSDAYKAKLIKDFSQKIIPGFQSSQLKPVIGKVISHKWQQNNANAFIQGHDIVQSNQTQGKVIISYD